jgi:SAM-dependent methyltransferase
MTLLDVVKDRTPWRIRRISRQMKRRLRQAREARMSCREVFTEIYEKHEWGTPGGADFYSGPGSNSDVAQPYADAVKALIAEKAIRSVIDIGCGDFRVGRMIADSGVRYLGVDIVDSLIDRNRTLFSSPEFSSPEISFMTGNVVDDDLPEADLCLVREVFQHLSNREIQGALLRLRKYPFVIVTDHQPGGTRFTCNRDKPHGRDIRVFARSALMLDKPPFNVPDVRSFLDLPSPNILLDPDERLRSFLITNAAARSRRMGAALNAVEAG